MDLFKNSVTSIGNQSTKSISQLVLSGLPSGIGKKGNRVNRKRKREPECTRVPLVSPNVVSTTFTTAPPESLPGPSHSSFNSPLSAQFMHWHTNRSCNENTGPSEPISAPSHSSFVPPDSVPMMLAMQWSTKVTYMFSHLVSGMHPTTDTSKCRFRLSTKYSASVLEVATSVCVMAAGTSLTSKPSHLMTCVFNTTNGARTPPQFQSYLNLDLGMLTTMQIPIAF